jgi:hypothetical protein
MINSGNACPDTRARVLEMRAEGAVDALDAHVDAAILDPQLRGDQQHTLGPLTK